MQTFLPYSNFRKCAEVLDYKRLNKQRSECIQILDAIENGTGWRHHPITKMWTGYEDALRMYFNYILKEWVERGYNNTLEYLEVKDGYKNPPWLGYERLHSSHRAALLAKDFDYYKQFNWKEEPAINYYWAGFSKGEQ